MVTSINIMGQVTLKSRSNFKEIDLGGGGRGWRIFRSELLLYKQSNIFDPPILDLNDDYHYIQIIRQVTLKSRSTFNEIFNDQEARSISSIED